MSVYLYEEALVERLRNVIHDDRVHIISPDLTSSFLAQFDKDKNHYPAITLTRNSVGIVKEMKNLPLMLKGNTSTVRDGLIQKARLIPMRIEWSLNIYAVDRYTCDEIVRELVFYFITQPKFYVKVPYGLDIEQEFDIILDSDIADNTDLNDFDDKGELFRNTLNLWTDNAYLFSQGLNYPINVEPEIGTIKKKI